MVHPIGLWNLENDRNMWEISDNIEFQVDISMMISSSWSFFTDFMEFFWGPGDVTLWQSTTGHVEIPQKQEVF